MASVAILFAVLSPGLAAAQTASGSAADALFQEVLQRPDDVDLSLRYAEAAAAEGNYEAAVATMERLLLIDGSLSVAKVRLGLLYLAMQSPLTASRYLEDALADPTLPDQQVEIAQRALDQAREGTSRHEWSGSLYFGLRWQTNANSGPDEDAIRDASAPGGTLATPASVAGRDDGNGFVLGSVRHQFDLQAQRFAVIDTRAVVYGTRYIERGELDSEAIRASTGPRFAPLPDSAPGLTVRPFVWTEYVRLDGSSYRTSFGGGIDGQWTVDPRLLLDWSLLVRYNDFAVTGRRPLANERDGLSFEGQVDGYYALTGSQVISTGAALARNSAEKDFNSYTRGTLAFTYSYRFEPPFEFVVAPWRLSVSAEGSVTGYDAPDPVIDPASTRHDLVGTVHVTQEIGLADDFALVLEAGYERAYSNIPNYDYDNVSGTVGIRYRF
ncbi:MAG: DUF2860 family protein [Rhodospirillaceae bacterium]|nr:DUF2860 family protein [Rhodospirillaceae bacterium]